MKKLLIATALFCATAMMVQAQDAGTPAPDASATQPAPKKHKLTPEQKKVMDEMLAKYDTNKDGKLDKTEKAAMSADDKAAWAKAFPSHSKKKGADAPATDAPAANAPAPAPKADDGK